MSQSTVAMSAIVCLPELVRTFDLHKGPCKIYLYTGPVQMGTGRYSFWATWKRGTGIILDVEKTGHLLFLYKGISEKQLGDAHQIL